jgi:hypothetical protein
MQQPPMQQGNPAQFQRGYQPPQASVDPFTEEVSFEPQHQQSFEPPKQQQKQQFQGDDFYNYGNVNLNQQQFNQQHSDDQQEEHFELQTPSNESAGNNMPQGNKTDLDMEIEKYQREIEEKQRRMRMQGQSPLPSQMPQQRAPEQMQPQNGNQFGQEQESDYDVYNMELSGYQGQNQPPTQRQPVVPASDNDDDMYFTSIDTDKQRKPIRKPLNPRTQQQQQQQQQQQKGFFSKFFNGNPREMP